MREVLCAGKQSGRIQCLQGLIHGNQRLVGGQAAGLGELDADLAGFRQPNAQRGDHVGTVFGQHLARRAGAADVPVFQHQQLVGFGQELVQLTRHQQHGDALVAQLQDQLVDVVGGAGIQVGGRLVEHDHLRAHGQHGRQAQFLHLPARQVPHQVLTPALQVGLSQQLLHDLLDRGRIQAQVFRSEGDLVFHIQHGEHHFRVLEDAPHLVRQGLDLGLADGLAGNVDLALQLTPVQVGDNAIEQVAQGGLARAAGADQYVQAAAPDLQRDIPQGWIGLVPVSIGDMLDVNQDVAILR